jgi:hypothetical protein
MPEPLRLELNEDEQHALEQARDHDPRPYVRERAAGLLKIAQGYSAHAVARYGLLKPHHPDTVYRWYHRYREEGLQSLRVKPGSGRKPAFSPSAAPAGPGGTPAPGPE